MIPALLSSSVHRISVLLNHVRPAHPSHLVALADVPDTQFDTAVCMGFVSHTHHLKLSNACLFAEEFKQSPDKLQRTLISTTNDVAAVGGLLAELVPSLHLSVLGRASVPQVKQTLQRVRQDHASGLVMYWSGHAVLGFHDLHLCFASERPGSSDERQVAVQDLLEWAGPGPLLLILDCCHSGAAMRAVERSRHDDKTLLMASCSSEEVSGAWILDGADSGGILTKFLTDPVGTYFKVQWGVFSDLEGTMLDPTTPLGRVYALLDSYLVRILDVLPPQDRLRLRSCGPHVERLWRHFLLLGRLGSVLYRPQTPVSVPCIGPCLACPLWGELEAVMEEAVVGEWKDKYCY